MHIFKVEYDEGKDGMDMIHIPQAFIFFFNTNYPTIHCYLKFFFDSILLQQ